MSWVYTHLLHRDRGLSSCTSRFVSDAILVEALWADFEGAVDADVLEAGPMGAFAARYVFQLVFEFSFPC